MILITFPHLVILAVILLIVIIIWYDVSSIVDNCYYTEGRSSYGTLALL